MLISELQDFAGIAAAAGLLAAGVWKIYLRLKSDTRNDSVNSRKAKSEADQYDHYDELIKTLREEVKRLADSVGSLSDELDTERLARHGAEEIASRLKLEVEWLKYEVKRLNKGV